MWKRKNKDIITEEMYIEEDDGMYELEEDRLGKIQILCIVLLAIGIAIATDVICLTKLEKGPYFAIRTETKEDGGTEIFYGLGYKVIKYHQTEGRNDTVLGFWTLEYSTNPKTTTVEELANQMTANEKEMMKEWNKEYIKITGNIYQVEEDKVILRYNEESSVNTLRIECQMDEILNLNTWKKGDQITLLGTIDTFTQQTFTTESTVYMKNCYLT